MSRKRRTKAGPPTGISRSNDVSVVSLSDAEWAGIVESLGRPADELEALLLPEWNLTFRSVVSMTVAEYVARLIAVQSMPTAREVSAEFGGLALRLMQFVEGLPEPMSGDGKLNLVALRLMASGRLDVARNAVLALAKTALAEAKHHNDRSLHKGPMEPVITQDFLAAIDDLRAVAGAPRGLPPATMAEIDAHRSPAFCFAKRCVAAAVDRLPPEPETEAHRAWDLAPASFIKRMRDARRRPTLVSQ